MYTRYHRLEFRASCMFRKPTDKIYSSCALECLMINKSTNVLTGDYVTNPAQLFYDKFICTRAAQPTAAQVDLWWWHLHGS